MHNIARSLRWYEPCHRCCNMGAPTQSLVKTDAISPRSILPLHSPPIAGILRRHRRYHQSLTATDDLAPVEFSNDSLSISPLHSHVLAASTHLPLWRAGGSHLVHNHAHAALEVCLTRTFHSSVSLLLKSDFDNNMGSFAYVPQPTIPPIRTLNISTPVLPSLGSFILSEPNKKNLGKNVNNPLSSRRRPDRQHPPLLASNPSSFPWPIMRKRLE
jgi:hypothetical protein